ncbi:hypothetical protein F4777DRAFT_537060 [Nemania sp. FL0916]|nr:hypothetical protein F4777DRAFT_537060 [Nemania sp. FL0916]
MTSLGHELGTVAQEFNKHWQSATDSNNLTLHGFRRFKTAHLLNLRFIEDEIARLDHVIYQAGLTLDIDHSNPDRLGLGRANREAQVPEVRDVATLETIFQLRGLLREYDGALIAFNHIMAMETFSLLDDQKQSSMRNDLNLWEKYNTRLLRTDLGIRSRTDPFQRHLHKYLRAFRYWRLSKNPQDSEAGRPTRLNKVWSYQNTIAIAEIIGRGTAVVITGVFFIVPLVILSHQGRGTQILTSSIFILAFSLIVTAMLKVSNLEMMVVTAAYAAVLATFISNVS